MRVFKSRWFHRWARREGVPDKALLRAIMEIERGLIDADLGGHVIKKRIALQGRGKRGGARTLIAYSVSNRAFFMYGFAKNQRATVSIEELHALKLVAQTLLAHDDEKLDHLIDAGELFEVTK